MALTSLYYTSVNKAFFPAIIVSGYEPRVIDGREFFFGLRDVKIPKLDEKFWDSPETTFRFEGNICEVCTGRVPKHYYCHKMYGGPFAQVYGAWVQTQLIERGYVDGITSFDRATRSKLWNESENKMREVVGVPKIGESFISETILFKTISYLLKGHEVIHHYRANWLARQELDIFIPSLNLAIEYQGEQHFVPIDAWGGADALEKTQLRDEEKRRKCQRKGITLIYFDHTMTLTEKLVARELKKTIAFHRYEDD